MPSVNITIPETIESVSRPIIYNIIDTIKKYTIIKGDVRIIFPGDIGQWTQTTGSLGDKTKESQFTSQRYIQLEVDQTPDESSLNSTALYYNENPPIIADPHNRFWVTPVYSRTNVVITIKFVTYNKDEAFRWYYNNRTAIANMRDVIMHTISYHYPLPDPLMSLVETIYTLQENQAPENISFQDYVKNHFTSRATTIAAQDGTHKRVAIAETQTRLLGSFEFNPLPEKPEIIEDNAAWTCSFSYKFSYDMPMSLNIKYPIMVHNQVLPYPYTELTLDPYHLRNKNLQTPISLGALRDFEIYRLTSPENPVFRIPKIDDFVPKNAIPYTTGFLYVLIELDPNNINHLLNLRDLDYVALDKSLLDFIGQTEYQYVTEPFQSMINISLYDFDTLMDSSSIYVDNNLNVCSTNQLDLRKTYRLRMSLYNRLDVINPDALSRTFYFNPTPTVVEIPTTPQPIPTNSLADIVGNGFNINLSIFENGVKVPVKTSDGSIIYRFVQNYNPTNTDTPKSNYIAGNDSSIPLNPNVIQNYVSTMLNSGESSINLSTASNTYTNKELVYLINNMFYNPFYRQKVETPDGSAVFINIINFLHISPVEVNKIYRLKKNKNLYLNMNTGLQDFTNPRMFGDKTLQLQSIPMISQTQNYNDAGFMTVMQYNIAAISITGDRSYGNS